MILLKFQIECHISVIYNVVIGWMGEFTLDEQRVPLPIGRFQNFDILDVIGFGGSSLCYLVKRGHAFFILKELYPSVLSAELIRDGVRLIGNPENTTDVQLNMAFFKEDFLLEAQISKDLVSYRRSEDLMGDNPYFFSLEDSFGIENSLSYYLVYQSKQGKTLSDYFKLSVENNSGRCIQVLSIMKQLAEAVSEVHDYGYLHLDLKLDNVYVIAYRSPVVVLLDLGSALKKDHIQEDNIEHSIRRISYAEQYSSLRLHSIFQKKRRLYQLLTLGYTSQQVRSYRDSIVNEISLLSESDDVYSLYVMLYELLTKTRMSERGQMKGFVETSQLDFLAVAVVEEIEKRILRGLNDEDRSMKQFIQDVDDIREFLMTEGIHPVLLKLKSEVQLNGRLSDLKFTVHPSIFTELETSASDKTIVYDDLVDYFQNQGSSHLVIVGEGGSGKSTQLMQLWKWLLDVRSTVVPFYIPLIEFENRRFSHLVDYILHLYGGHFTENRRERLFQLFADSEGWQFVFLLDGFNEVANKEALYGQIEELAQYPGVRLIMTSRYPYTGYLDHTTLNVKDLRKDQIEKFASELQVRFLADSDLHKRPMLLSLACRASHYLNEPLLSQSDLKKLDVRNSPYRMEMIADFFSAQKIKHYLNFHHRWDDVRVVLRMMAYDVVLPLVARFMFEKKSNSLDLDELVELLMNYFDSKGETFFRSPLLKKIYKVNQILPSNLDFVYNHLINDLLSDELSLIKVSESVSFVSEVYQDYFLAFQMFRDIAFPDDMDVPLIKNHRFSYEQLRSVGELLREYRFADPRVNSRGISYVELFLNRYRYIFDGSTGLLVKNAVELMRISRNGLILADLSYLDLRQTKLTGSLFSTMGEIDCQPASFRGSHLSDTAFQTVEHRKAVDRIVVSDDARHVVSYSSAEAVTKIWDAEWNEYVCEFSGKYESSVFLDDFHLVSVSKTQLYLHDIRDGQEVSCCDVGQVMVNEMNDRASFVQMMGIVGRSVYIGFRFSGEDRSKLHVAVITIEDFLFGEPEEKFEVDLEDFVSDPYFYGLDTNEKDTGIFEVEGKTFMILIGLKDSKVDQMSRLFLLDFDDFKVLGTMYANIDLDVRVFKSKDSSVLYFMNYNQKSRKSSVVSWDLHSKSIKVLGNYKDKPLILGICEKTGTILDKHVYKLRASRFIKNYQTTSKMSTEISGLTFQGSKIPLQHLCIKQGKLFLLYQFADRIVTFDSASLGMKSTLKICSDKNFKDIYFENDKAYLIFDHKMMIYNINEKIVYKSFFENEMLISRVGYESFPLRKKLIDSTDMVEHQKAVFYKIHSWFFNRGHHKYYDVRFRNKIEDRLSTIISEYRDDRTNEEHRICMTDDFRSLYKISKINNKWNEINLNDHLISIELLVKHIDSYLYLIHPFGIIAVNLNRFDNVSLSYDLFKPYVEISPDDKALKNVRNFEHINYENKDFYLLSYDSTCVVLTNSEYDSLKLAVLLNIEDVQISCFSSHALYLADYKGNVASMRLNDLIGISESGIRSTLRELVLEKSLAKYVESMQSDFGELYDLRYYHDTLYLIFKSMRLGVWREKESVKMEVYDLLDTNIIKCDVSDSVGLRDQIYTPKLEV